MPRTELTPYGFKMGSVEVTRIAALVAGKRGEYVVIEVRTPYTAIEIQSTPAGKTLHVTEQSGPRDCSRLRRGGRVVFRARRPVVDP